MKKGVQFSVWIFGIGTVFVAAGLGTAHVLKLYHLMFRAWVEMTFYAIVVLLSAALAGSIIYTLGKMFSLPQEQPKKRIARKAMSVFGIISTLLGIGILGLVIFFSTVFGHTSEEVVEKYGQKMVAYEEHWLDTSITYHEYKNFLVCGYPVLGYEIYGAGFYTYEFYDAQGNLIARPQNEQSTSQNDESEQSESRSEAKPQVEILDIIVEENQILLPATYQLSCYDKRRTHGVYCVEEAEGEHLACCPPGRGHGRLRPLYVCGRDSEDRPDVP